MRHTAAATVLFLALVVLATPGRAQIGDAAKEQPAPPPPTEQAAPDAVAPSASEPATAYPSTPMLGLVVILPAGDSAVQVVRVSPGGPAEAAGIVEGDRLQAVDGQAIASPETLRDVLRQKHVGDRVELAIVRDGQEQTLPVTLASRDLPPPPSADAVVDPADMPANSAAEPAFGDEPSSAGEPEDALAGTAVWLGLALEPGEGGVRVAAVYPASPAAAAGFQNGDLVLRVGDRETPNPGDILSAIADLHPGDHVTVIVRRGEKEMPLDVTLAQRAVAAGPTQPKSADEVPGQSSPGTLLEDMAGDEAPQDLFPGMDEVGKFVEEQTSPDHRYQDLEQRYNDLRREVDELKRELQELREQRTAAPPDPPAPAEDPST